MRPVLVSLSLVAMTSCVTLYEPRHDVDPSVSQADARYPDLALHAVTSAMGMDLADMVSWPAQLAGLVERMDVSDMLLEVVAQYRDEQDAEVFAQAVSKATGHSVDKVLIAMAEIESSAARYGVPTSLLAALIHRESSFNPDAKSSAGAIGLSQIMPAYWSKVCDDLDSVKGNVDCGAKVLAEYYGQAGDWDRALAYYNVGPNNFRTSSRHRAVGMSYAKRVLHSKRGIERQLALLSAQ